MFFILGLAGLAVLVAALALLFQWVQSREAMVMLTGALVLVGICSFGASLLQWSVMRGQLDAMAADRRPWVAIDAEVGGITWRPEGATIPIKYLLTNTGRSPAMNVFVRDEIVAFIAPPPANGPIPRLKAVLSEVQQRPETGFGTFTLFPNEKRPMLSAGNFSRVNLTAFQKYIQTFGAPGDDPTTQRASVTAVPLTIVYIVDYGSDLGGMRHQTFCWASIGRPDPDHPLSSGLPLEADVNVSPLKLTYGNVDCGAN